MAMRARFFWVWGLGLKFNPHACVRDFIEIYHYLIDDFLLDYCRGLRVKDFIEKSVVANRNKMGKREYLRDKLTKGLMKDLEGLFKSKLIFPESKLGTDRMFRL